MYRHYPVRSGLDAAGEWIEIETIVPGIYADIFLAKLQRLGNPAARVRRYERSPSFGCGCLGILFRVSERSQGKR